MAKQSDRAMPQRPARPKPAFSHTTYKQAHSLYSGMTALDLRAHELAMRHVRDGFAPKTQQQLSDEY